MKLNIFYEDDTIEEEVDLNTKVEDLLTILSIKLGIASSLLKLTLQMPSYKVPLNPSHLLSEYSLSPTTIIFLKVLRTKKPSIPHRRTQSELSPWVNKLVVACQEGNLDDFYEILQDYERYKNASLEVEDLQSLLNTAYNGKWCCIHYAVYMNHSAMVKELLDLAANCNAITNDHWTPLQISCYQGHSECVQLLLQHPLIQIDQMTSLRGTGLHLASQNGHTEIVKMLLERGIDVNLEDPNGLTALELASNIHIAELIPKFIGQELLKKYSLEDFEKPLGFSGEVWFTTGSASTENLVYLVLDIEKGNFVHYKSRQNFVDEKPPKYSISFGKIIEVKVSSEVYDDKYFFLISTSDIKLKYYTSFEDMSKEWTHRILEAINYFRNPNRVTNVNNPLPPTIQEQTVHLYSFEIISEIGSGSYGKVFKVKKKNTEEIYALKSLSQAYLRQKQQIKYAIAECKIMKSIRHPFILPLFWAFQSETHLFMVLEYCPFGDFFNLLQYIHHLTVAQARFYISEIILAIEYLHSLSIIYRDLKPQNILLDELGHIRLADFGLAKQNVTQENPAMTFCGSPAYLVPEMIERKGVWKAADIYTIGANLYEFIVGEPPFYSNDIDIIYERIKHEDVKFFEGFDENAKDLITKCMKKNPEERIGIEEIKSHQFFQDTHWENISKKNAAPPFSNHFLKNIKKD